MKREPVDFEAIPQGHKTIHGRLENWSLSVRGGSGGSSASPMFRLYITPDYWHAPSVRPVCDAIDASRIAKGVAALPEPHRLALQWFYIRPGPPIHARREIGCTLDGLALYVNDGRTMLINRRV
jgi:hypothetical protein